MAIAMKYGSIVGNWSEMRPVMIDEKQARALRDYQLGE